MSDAPLMLGVSGLRGITGRSLTLDVAQRYAGAFAAWLEGRGGSSIVIGRDGRAGGGEIHAAIAEVFVAAGFRVADLGVAMTPTVGVMVDELRGDGAMIVTASHNPQEWNGLKCLVRERGTNGASAAAPSATVASEIIAIFNSGRVAPASSGGEVGGVGTAARTHVWRVLAAAGDLGLLQKPARPPRVVLDSVNASGVEGGRMLLAQALGCELIHHGSEDSGIFPHPPEPTKDNLGDLGRAVARFNAQAGFAQDPDADRLAIIDENARYIGEEYTLALAAESLLSAAPPTGRPRVLVTNLSTSRMLEDIAARHGARVLRTPVGEANVVEVMKREAAAGSEVVLGGEGNGGVIWPKVTYVRDSLSAMALVLSLMARTGRTLGELVAAIPSYAIEKRKVDLARKEDALPAIESVARAYREHRVDLQDGVRVDFTTGKLSWRAWLHVRASNTEPIMRLIAEAPTVSDSRRILDDAAAVIARG
jgi:phosphomannomutase